MTIKSGTSVVSNSEFKYQSEVKYTGLDTRPYSGQYWGTGTFRSGNCDIALNGNV